MHIESPIGTPRRNTPSSQAPARPWLRRRRVQYRCWPPIPLLACLLIGLVAGGCDEPFSPTAETEIQFSIFGYFDAAADTQWVRVMPIRPLASTSPEPFGAIVTLEHLLTGQRIQLRDSVFNLTHHTDPGLGSEGAYVHNFWTTESLQPGATYQFSASLDGDPPAEALVRIPDEYELEVFVGQSYWTDYIRVTGLEHIPFVKTNTHFYDRCGSAVDSVWFRERDFHGDSYTIPVRREPVTPREGCDGLGVERRELWIVGSESPWPSIADYPTWALAVPEQASNVTNALGFIGGVLSRTIPYEDCTLPGGGTPGQEHCRLSYGPESAGFTGFVTETRCGDGLIDSVTVELREIDREPPSARKTRTAMTDRGGEFGIWALDPGIRYALKVRAKPEPDPFWGEVDIYTLHYDTLEFQPGERVRYDVGLRRLTDCGGTP